MTMERWRPRWGTWPWRPFRELEDMESRLGDLFDRAMGPWWRPSTTGRGWLPPVEMFEKDDRFVIRAELPGMTQEDIDISIVGDTLTIKGERKADTEIKEENYYHCERAYGSFTRSITIPAAVDTEKVEASYKNGILEINLPKVPEVKPKKVQIGIK
ncbi:MAG: Hsp20/alpha crystallin family protein [Chloroflexi bacterium]|nr:MAG: Hsp20/alpha crystallin family protein [Chloroflexota bacterium]